MLICRHALYIKHIQIELLTYLHYISLHCITLHFIQLYFIYTYGSVSKPCTPVVHIKIAGFKMDVHPIKNGICIDIDP